MDAEVPEHRVGFPATKEHDGVLVNVGAEKGSGAARAKGASAEEGGVDARSVLNKLSGVAESVRDVLRLDVVPLLTCRVEVAMDRDVRGSLRTLKAEADPAESLAGAQERIGGRFVTDLFAADSILLVIEFQRGELNGGDVRVIQRCCRGGVNFAGHGEVDVAEREGLRPGFGGGGRKVLGGAQEPPEGDDDEVDGVGVEEPKFIVIDVEGSWEASEVSDVGQVGPAGRCVFVCHGFEERSE